MEFAAIRNSCKILYKIYKSITIIYGFTTGVGQRLTKVILPRGRCSCKDLSLVSRTSSLGDVPGHVQPLTVVLDPTHGPDGSWVLGPIKYLKGTN